MVKGRSNYPTQSNPDATCDDCMGTGPDECDWCDTTCPYLDARDEAMNADVGILNTAYLLNVWNRRPSMDGPFKGYRLVVVDECDLLESGLMGYAEVRITAATIRRYKLGYPDRKTVRESWLAWAEATPSKLGSRLARVGGNSLRAQRERKRLARMIAEVKHLATELADEDSKWVYSPEGDAIVFKPVTVSQLGESHLWRWSDRFLLMSASIISADQMAADLGIPEDWEYETVTVPSTFPVANRPIHVVNVGSMGRKTAEATTPRLLAAVTRIVERHPGERVLVHTVSYRLAQIVGDHLTRHLDTRIVVTYTDGAGREAALNRYLGTPGAVMVAPSMDRGVDLPGDMCRVQVVAKVPYPSLGDEQIKARLYGTRGGKTWYAVQTVRTLVQMTGRGVRSADDRATTYILDGNFVGMFRQWKQLFPTWWREALEWDGTMRRTLDL